MLESDVHVALRQHKVKHGVVAMGFHGGHSGQAKNVATPKRGSLTSRTFKNNPILPAPSTKGILHRDADIKDSILNLVHLLVCLKFGNELQSTVIPNVCVTSLQRVSVCSRKRVFRKECVFVQSRAYSLVYDALTTCSTDNDW